MRKQSIPKILLIVLMSMTGTNAFAYDIAVNNDDGVTIYYNYINGGKELEVTYEGDLNEASYEGVVNIPETVMVGSSSFKVTAIGEFAFHFGELTSVTIPTSVTKIDGSAFRFCTLTSITIPNSVTTIGCDAFDSCKRLKSITLPNSITVINNNTFFGCDSLTSVIIPNSVTSIENMVFAYCMDLKYIDIPNSVTSIGDGIFRGCWSMNSITFPNSVTTIGDYAFEYCGNLRSVTFGSGLTKIGNGVFSECNRLSSLTINSDLGFLGGGVFAVTSMESLTIGSGVTSLNGWSFLNIEFEKVVSWVEDPFEIKGNDAFWDRVLDENTFNNATLYVPEGAVDKYKSTKGWKDFANIAENETIRVDNADGLTLYCTKNDNNLTIVTGNYAGDVTIPEELTYKGETMKVISIGKNAFYGCAGVTSVSIPRSVTSIGDYAFRGCHGLSSVVIPSSVTSIEYSSFQYCNGLTSIRVEEGNNTYDSRQDCNAIIETASNTLILGCGNSWIPDGVTAIGYCAFQGCKFLKSLQIPASVTSIGNYAFGECYDLSSLILSNNITFIGGWAFYGIDFESVTSQIVEPFEMDNVFSENTVQNAILYVPFGTLDKYKATIGWKEFSNIVETDISGIQRITSDRQINTVYDLNGRRLSRPQKGINIIRGKKVLRHTDITD